MLLRLRWLSRGWVLLTGGEMYLLRKLETWAFTLLLEKLDGCCEMDWQPEGTEQNKRTSCKVSIELHDTITLIEGLVRTQQGVRGSPRVYEKTGAKHHAKSSNLHDQSILSTVLAHGFMHYHHIITSWIVHGLCDHTSSHSFTFAATESRLRMCA